MLEIKLERAFEPEMMQEQPCAICGAEFEPKAVLAQVAHAKNEEHAPMCEPCLEHLARRAEHEEIPANWNEIYRRYLELVPQYPEPVFPSVEAVLEAERRDLNATMALAQEAWSI